MNDYTSTLPIASYDPTAFHDNPRCEAAQIYWHQHLKSLILKSHPRYSITRNNDFINEEDLWMDGYEAVRKALFEYDPNKWDSTIVAFLLIRVPQRLLDSTRMNRRGVAVAKIVNEILKANPEIKATNFEAISVAIIESGLWIKWLGTPTPRLLKAAEEAMRIGFESSHARFDAAENSGIGFSGHSLAAKNVADPFFDTSLIETNQMTINAVRHLVGMDRELLLNAASLRGNDDEYISNRENAFTDYAREGVSYEIEAAKRAMVIAGNYGRHFAGLFEGAHWGSGVDRKIVKACPDCGLIFPMLADGNCLRAECAYGEGEIPDGFTFEFWAPYALLADRRQALVTYLKLMTVTDSKTKARKLALSAGWVPDADKAVAAADFAYAYALRVIQKKKHGLLLAGKAEKKRLNEATESDPLM